MNHTTRARLSAAIESLLSARGTLLHLTNTPQSHDTRTTLTTALARLDCIIGDTVALLTTSNTTPN